MFGWFSKKSDDGFKEDVKKSFSSVKKDMDVVGKWVKHLDSQDKQLFEILKELENEISTIKSELGGIRESIQMSQDSEKDRQLFKKLPVLNKQTAVYDVQEAVQTAVQTGNLYDILRNLSSNERLVLFTLMNNEMKLSYEDLAMLLGKERSTIRGQINAIKQKSEGLIEEITEKNGKKRVYVPDEIKEKLSKYAKVRVSKGKKSGRSSEK